ncbi:CD48 antigen-like [Pseudorasbora parva]|uniref:CD48 antigen-like n=1 Tax=Pseudorasbora parva TaxID=51549 RepID=UPI00351E8BFB
MYKEICDVFIFFCLCVWSGVFSADAVQSESVMEGESVTLNSGLTQIQKKDLITWGYGHNNIIIATVKEKSQPDFPDGRFSDRLKLDHQTGSLTITHTRTEDSGLYKVSSTSRETLNTFSLTVYARLPVPVISLSSKKSSSSNCSLVCSSSVLNVSHVTLSWFKGNSSLSSISVSDISRSLSLPLEVECLDDSYSCVLNNPIRNQTTHPNTELCQPCSTDCKTSCHSVDIHCCGFTEAVIRLALSAVVGVAAVVVLVYDIRSRSLQQKRREQTSPSNSD